MQGSGEIDTDTNIDSHIDTFSYTGFDTEYVFPQFPHKDFTYFLFSLVLFIISIFLLCEGAQFLKRLTEKKKYKYDFETIVKTPITASFGILAIWAVYLYFYPSLYKLKSDLSHKEYFLLLDALIHPRIFAPVFLLASLIPALVGLLKFSTATILSFQYETKNKKENSSFKRLTWSAIIGAIITAITLATTAVSLYKELIPTKEVTQAEGTRASSEGGLPGEFDSGTHF